MAPNLNQNKCLKRQNKKGKKTENTFYVWWGEGKLLLSDKNCKTESRPHINFFLRLTQGQTTYKTLVFLSAAEVCIWLTNQMTKCYFAVKTENCVCVCVCLLGNRLFPLHIFFVNIFHCVCSYISVFCYMYVSEFIYVPRDIRLYLSIYLKICIYIYQYTLTQMIMATIVLIRMYMYVFFLHV